MSTAATDAPPGATTTQTAAKCALLRREILTRDPEIHARAGLDERAVALYAKLMKDGAEFPPLVAFDDGAVLWLADGFLRDAAAERAGFDVLPCDVRKGTRRAAQLFAIRANARHGRALTPADRRRAVERLLDDPEWSRWSDRTLAKLAGVSHSVINRARRRRPELKGRPRVTVRGGQVYDWTPPRETRPPNYYSDYLYYLVRLTPEQFERWRQIVNLRTDRRVLAAALETVLSEPPTPQEAQATKPEAPPNYIANWLYYLTTMTPAQLMRWRAIIKSRADLSALAEAVDLVVREAATQPGQADS
ncbi:MAG TPA: hypothetical protein VF659_24210 [Pyrinomonadaceae bacterium]|jgi:hypothetical protein